jgi:hypothetical protein
MLRIDVQCPFAQRYVRAGNGTLLPQLHGSLVECLSFAVVV